jgi:hypothetical protein
MKAGISSPAFATKWILSLFLLLEGSAPVRACKELVVTSQADLQAMLPPSPEWEPSAEGELFMVDSDDPLITPVEASGFNETATYQQVTDFFVDLAAQSDFVQVESLMKFANGEDLWLVKISGEGAFDKDTSNVTNPIVYMTAGIHPGESSGVNAGMVRASRCDV